jgi:hypothetical protein
MNLCSNRITPGLDRRSMLRTLAFGFGWTAFNGLAGAASRSLLLPGDGPLSPKSPHFAGTAKRVIFLYMAGAPSHVDTFDHKPELTRMNGTSVRRNATLLGSPWRFRPRGESGLMISDLFPEVGAHADRLCLLRGMKAGIPAHAQASMQMHTGSFQFVRPSMGAWSVYGLGSENENLPGFITINPGNQGAGSYGSGFLPAAYQGTPVDLPRNGAIAEALPHLDNEHHGSEVQQRQLHFLRQLERERERREGRSAPVESVLEQYELAFRMQTEVPGVVDIAGEDRRTLEMYGIGEDGTDQFGRQCLLARRLAEEGVRFIELTAGGWDTHRNMREELANRCQAVDKPIAGLLADLQQRRMLDDTLVVWGGEFGRTPYAQGDDGRDHNAKGFTMWMAGGGVKGGVSYGSTDETGGEAVEGVMDIHDWHATILHALGLDHERLTFNHAGRDFRLTDVHGKVHSGVFA